MPSAPARPCRKAGCPNAVRSNSAFCKAHSAERSVDHDRLRESARKRGYDRRWDLVRRTQLAREPVCRACRARGKTRAATMVDHVVPIRAGGARLAPENLQSLCWPCHARKTQADKARYPELYQ